MHKTVKHLIPAETINMGGIFVKQALPTQNVAEVGPFILLHHGTFKFRKDAPAKHQGIGPHPHRGFSPVTFVIDGEVHHRDSRGHSQIATTGEVQWMNAGAGIIHSERPSQALVDKGGSQEVIQLWVNSPAGHKMKPPTYTYISNDDVKTFSSADGFFTNKVIAGSHQDMVGNINPLSSLSIVWCQSKSDGLQEHKIDHTHQSMLYLIKGEAIIKGYGKVEAEHLVVFQSNGDNITVESKGACQYLLLTGEPLQEKRVQQGPFVMNTETEILEAMRDYQMGKLGILIEE